MTPKYVRLQSTIKHQHFFIRIINNFLKQNELDFKRKRFIEFEKKNK